MTPEALLNYALLGAIGLVIVTFLGLVVWMFIETIQECFSHDDEGK